MSMLQFSVCLYIYIYILAPANSYPFLATDGWIDRVLLI